MKKFTTLLCLGALAVAANAQLPAKYAHPSQDLELGPNAMQTALALQEEAQAQIATGNEVLTRSFTDTKGTTWEMTLTKSMEYSWSDFYGRYDDQGNYTPVEFEEWPFYIGMLQFRTADQKTLYWYILSWPSNLYYKQAFGKDPNYNVNDSGTFDWECADPEELLNASDDLISTFKQVNYSKDLKVGYLPYTWDPEDIGPDGQSTGMPIYWSMVGVNQLFTNKVKYNDRETIMHVPLSVEEQARVEFDTFNPATRYISAYMKMTHEFTANNTTGTTTLNWEGPALKLSGFRQFTYDFPEIAEVHILKDKIYDEEGLSLLGYQEIGMEDVYRYYIAAYSEGLTLGYDTSGNPDDFSFDAEKLGYYPVDGVKPESSKVNFFIGALYAPTQWEDFENRGLFTMEKYELGEEIINGTTVSYCKMYPHEMSLIPSAFDFIPCSRYHDGLIGVYGQYYMFLREPSFLKFGTTDGIVGQFTDNTGDKWNVRYDGVIYYHGDPTDVRNDVQIESIGTDDSGVENIFTESALNVTVENGSIVAPAGSTIYDMNGRRISGQNAGKGVYVVRNGKQAVKVLVK